MVYALRFDREETTVREILWGIYIYMYMNSEALQYASWQQSEKNSPKQTAFCVLVIGRNQSVIL